MKNTVTLFGFVGNNPEVRTTQGGTGITSISLATSRSFKDGEGNRQNETEWHRITCFNGVGKSVAEHVTKGAMIMVTPLATVGKLLGHVLPETTARYTHLADTLISETAERLCSGLASAFGLAHDQF